MRENMNNELPDIIDLFCGCGGMSLGFQNASFKVIHGFDNWQPAVETYSQNLDHDARLTDLGDIEQTIEALQPFFSELGTTPAIIGGPPCQDFSSAGKRVEGTRADLTEKFAMIVSHFNPPFFVMENVPRAKSARVYKSALDRIKAAGYNVISLEINANRCKVPQNRKRLFTIGTKTESLIISIKELIERNQDENAHTLRDEFGDSLGVEHFYMHPRSYTRRGIFSIDEPSPTIRGVNRPIPPNYGMHPNDTSTTKGIRHLSTIERAQIQTFPSTFKLPDAKTTAEQLIGNAVPVRLAEFIATQIKTAYALSDWNEPGTKNYESAAVNECAE